LFDFADLPSKTRFWKTAEQQIIDSLKVYAEHAEMGGASRRLFAEDAARGFAFIDLCRKRYDAVVMNPPFGDWTTKYKTSAKKAFPNSYNDILAAFVERGGRMLQEKGRLGAITSRACFFLTTFKKWRENIVLQLLTPRLLVDLGHGVMDAAMVEAAAYVLEKAERVTEGAMACYRLLENENPSKALGQAIQSENVGEIQDCAYWLDPSSFLQIPKAPFAYWVSERIRGLFSKLEPLEESGRDVQSGASTMDDFRFLRLAWETAPDRKACSREDTNNGKRWVTLAKGGAFSRYYIDWELVLDWEHDGRCLKAHVSEYRGQKGWGYHWAAAINGHSEYFRPGLTWPRRTQGGLSVRTLPRGSVFGDKGPVIFAPNNDKRTLWALLAVTNSLPFRGLVSLQMSFGSYEVGVLERTPIPELSEGRIHNLGDLARQAWNLQHSFHSVSLIDHDFISIRASASEGSLIEQAGEIRDHHQDHLKKLNELQSQINDAVFQFYEIELPDRRVFETGDLETPESAENSSNLSRSAEGKEDSDEFATDIPDYLIGCALGRWDIRYATGERQPPELPDPFDPLPACPPGMLQNADGLPAEPADVPEEYPLRISWPGILVDDEGHPEDIVARVRDALAVIWRDRADAIEAEACDILKVKSLRDYFGKPTKFFADHLKRYSKSRRKAPIYWPLSTESGSYTVWIYYHRLTDQTLYSVVNDHVTPKLDVVESDLARVQERMQDGITQADRAAFETLQNFRQELIAFRDELLRIAQLPYKPDLNDGVQITAAPLWKLFRHKPWQKVLKQTWKKLEHGDYDWAHLALSIWPQRVIRASHQDRSYAIAHGLEDQLWHEVEVSDKKGKNKTEWRPRDLSEEELINIIESARHT
jgi:hypothetical protein